MWSYFIWKHWFCCLGRFISFLPLPIITKAIGQEGRMLPNAVVTIIVIGSSVGILLLGKPWINIADPKGKKTFRRLKNGFSRCLPCFCRENLDYVPLESHVSLHRERRYNSLILKKVILLTALFSTFGTFNMLRTQLTSTFVLQAENLHNKSPLGSHAMNMFTPLLVLLCVPFIELYNRRKGHWENMVNLDILLSGAAPLILASLAAAVLEVYIKRGIEKSPGQEDSGITFWVQAPQYVLIGMGDILSFIPASEFSYKESPVGVQGFICGMLYSAGSFLALMMFIIETVVFTKYVDVNSIALLENHFFVVNGAAAGCFIFLALPVCFIYRRFIERTFSRIEPPDISTSSMVESMES